MNEENRIEVANRRENRKGQQIHLTPKEQKAFQKIIKIGIYKAMNRKNILTDSQLILLMEKNNA